MNSEDKFTIEAKNVDFLKERWEIELYSRVLKSAEEWGKKIDEENLTCKKKLKFADKYNS